MSRFLLPLGVFAALVLVLAIGVQRAPEKSVIQSALLGKPAPDFVAPVLGSPDGARFEAKSMRGRWYLLNVWGTWCAECRNEHATLLQIKAAGKAPIIGLDWKDQPQDALQWLQQLGNPYDIVAEDRDGRIAIDASGAGVAGVGEDRRTHFARDRGAGESQVANLRAGEFQKLFLEFVTAIPDDETA